MVRVTLPPCDPPAPFSSPSPSSPPASARTTPPQRDAASRRTGPSATPTTTASAGASDDVDDPDLSGRYEDIDDTKPEAELVALAETIRRLDADVLALQEIESHDALHAFIEAHIPGLYPHVVSLDAGDERGIEQAVLSRFPIIHAENWPGLTLGGTHPDSWGDQENWHAGEPITFHRSPLRVDVEVPPTDDRPEAYGLTLFVVHQKSGFHGEYWRIAEATRLAEITGRIMDAEPDRNVVVLGDFNATPEQPPMRILLDVGLIDAMAGASGPETTTHASGRRIDAILLSPAAMDDVVDGSAFVLGTPARPAGSDWRTTPPPPGYASDHYPVAIDVIPLDH